MKMKLIEAMKKLKVIEKRIIANSHQIQEYSSCVSTEKFAFETEDAQRGQVKGLLQSCEDLFQEYLELKQRIELTNLKVIVEIGGKKRTISDLLVIKRRLANLMLGAYSSLSTRAADTRLRNAPTIGEQKPQVIRLYREEERNESLRKWQDLVDNIDSRLEVVNATTELMGE